MYQIIHKIFFENSSYLQIRTIKDYKESIDSLKCGWMSGILLISVSSFFDINYIPEPICNKWRVNKVIWLYKLLVFPEFRCFTIYTFKLLLVQEKLINGLLHKQINTISQYMFSIWKQCNVNSHTHAQVWHRHIVWLMNFPHRNSTWILCFMSWLCKWDNWCCQQPTFILVLSWNGFASFSLLDSHEKCRKYLCVRKSFSTFCRFIVLAHIFHASHKMVFHL